MTEEAPRELSAIQIDFLAGEKLAPRLNDERREMLYAPESGKSNVEVTLRTQASRARTFAETAAGPGFFFVRTRTGAGKTLQAKGR